jgi:hypothetical protein
MIRHTVAFTLHHRAGSPEEEEFLGAARVLADIPGVQRFEQLRQVSSTSDYAYSFSMEFATEQDYLNYNEHPTHREFVQTRWQSEVAAFQELDFVPL